MEFISHLVRVGSLGNVGRFRSADGIRYGRRRRVLCRTIRGLEVGEVLADADAARPTDGELLRALASEDELLLARIEQRRDEAFQACSELVADRGLPVVLMDVEHLFDGQSLYFYFLGEITQDVEALTSELATVYETRVQFGKFSQTLADGCGPDCGTADGAGCQSSGCSSCALAGACGTSR